MRKEYSNRIYLTGHIRRLLLREICRHEDVINFCNTTKELALELEQIRGNRYRGICPWCQKPGAFSMNRKSGEGSCCHCGEAGDYLDLVCLVRDEDLNEAIPFLSGLLAAYEESAANLQREQRQRNRRLRKLMAIVKPEGGAA